MALSLISNRYALEQRLGSGGMSTVFRATDRVLERTVAVKMLAEHLADDEKFVARFRREALAVAKLTHPNIVQVYDTGVDGGRHYIVMEYVSGRSGAQVLQSTGKVEPRLTVGIAVQACGGLDYAHRHGIVHRDVKPGNLMIIGGPASSEGGTEMAVKLTDFGIARAAEQTRLTQVGSVVGTAAYLSPEQARGEEATPASDVYALGVVSYQLLTGRLPFEGASLAELTVRREKERPLSPTAYDRDIPDALAATVLRSIENERERRYQDAGSLAEALRGGLAGQAPPPGTAATSVLAAGAATAATRRIEPAAPSRPDRRPPRPVITPAEQPPRSLAARIGRALGALGLMLLVAAIVAGVILLVTDAGQQTDLGQVIENSVNDQIERLEDIIRENSN